jgi:predicted nucleic acid-binding protein
VNGKGLPGADEVQRVIGVWITLVVVKNRSGIMRLQSDTGLQAGECEAILLAAQLQIRTVVLDDRQGIREAEARKLRAVRTPALYLAAKRARIIERVKPKLDVLRSSGFRLRDEHYRMILQQAGEF